MHPWSPKRGFGGHWLAPILIYYHGNHWISHCLPALRQTYYFVQLCSDPQRANKWGCGGPCSSDVCGLQWLVCLSSECSVENYPERYVTSATMKSSECYLLCIKSSLMILSLVTYCLSLRHSVSGQNALVYVCVCLCVFLYVCGECRCVSECVCVCVEVFDRETVRNNEKCVWRDYFLAYFLAKHVLICPSSSIHYEDTIHSQRFKAELHLSNIFFCVYVSVPVFCCAWGWGIGS